MKYLPYLLMMPTVIFVIGFLIYGYIKCPLQEKLTILFLLSFATGLILLIQIYY